MKRLMSLTLALFMILSLTACGGQKNQEPAGETNKQNKPESVVYTLDNVPTPQLDPVEKSKNSAEYTERVIMGDCGIKSDITVNLNASTSERKRQEKAAIQDLHDKRLKNIEIIKAEYESSIKKAKALLTDYEKVLKDEGFTIEPKEQGPGTYSSSATKDNAYISLYLDLREGVTDPEDIIKMCNTEMAIFDVNITINKPTTQSNNSGNNETESFDTQWASNEYEKLIPEPPQAKYRNSTFENDFEKYYHMYASNIAKEVVLNYTDQLKRCGYNMDVVEKPDGDGKDSFYFEGCNKDKIKVKVTISNTPGGDQTTISIAIPK